MERIVVVGASRGLGAELCRVVLPLHSVLGVARHLPNPPWASSSSRFHRYDLNEDIGVMLKEIESFGPTRIFYLAGGGPYGEFDKKAWKDHLWAWNVSFLAAARVLHAALQFSKPPGQIVLCGSSIAENEGDAKAASYASAKHALRGLYMSLRAEKPDFDLRLFSPGYLDTGLLPKNAEVRYKGVWKPETAAKELWDWSCSSDHGGHRVYSPHPE